MSKIKVPQLYQEQQDRLAQIKIDECREKLNKFTEEEGIFIGAIIRYTKTGILPDVIVLPKQFISVNKQENEKGVINTP